jgi:hypothetical protein
MNGAIHEFVIKGEHFSVDAIHLCMCQTGRKRLRSVQMHLTAFELFGDILGPSELISQRQRFAVSSPVSALTDTEAEFIADDGEQLSCGSVASAGSAEPAGAVVPDEGVRLLWESGPGAGQPRAAWTTTGSEREANVWARPTLTAAAAEIEAIVPVVTEWAAQTPEIEGSAFLIPDTNCPATSSRVLSHRRSGYLRDGASGEVICRVAGSPER